MTVPGTVARPAKKPARVSADRLAIPSWLVSLLFHCGVLALLAVSFRQPRLIGNPNADPQAAGVYFESGGDDIPGPPGGGSGEVTATIDSPDAEGTADAEGTDSSFDDLKVEETPPVKLDLPPVSALRIKPGTGMPVETSAHDARQMFKSSSALSRRGGVLSLGSGTADGGSGGGTGGGSGDGVGNGSGKNGGTSFFGQRATGVRFLYLLDASGSMQDYNALGVAKAELLASLAQLDTEQQFQVIFYSERCYPMDHPDGRSQYFTATDINRTKASQFVRGISPLEGTRHLEALLMALNYKPDVIFFLTDAGEPRLSAGDLDKIRKRNGEKSQIHTIEFGKHANLNIDSNFLKRLARENRGGYVYRDITQFSKDSR